MVLQQIYITTQNNKRPSQVDLCLNYTSITVIIVKIDASMEIVRIESKRFLFRHHTVDGLQFLFCFERGISIRLVFYFFYRTNRNERDVC